MKKIVICLMLLASANLFANNNAQRSDLIDYINSIGIKGLEVLSNERVCLPQCQDQRRLNEGRYKYKTIITSFDAITGITTCDVIGENGLSAGFTANTKNLKCVEDTNYIVPRDKLTTLKKENEIKEKLEISYHEQPEGYLTLSKFIASMMTLDPEIINFDASNKTGLLQLKDNLFLSPIQQMNASDNQSVQVVKSIADELNKANLAYYGNLFSNMSEIYDYVQNLLFIFVGMFFLGKVGFEKTARALDKSSNTGDTQWLQKFYAPVLAVGFFFAPIPEENNMNATIVQKTIRFMTQESNHIADRASAIGVNTYVQKLYATVGAMSAASEYEMRKNVGSGKAQSKIYENAVAEICNKRFPSIRSYISVNTREAIGHIRSDNNNVSAIGNGLQDITFNACKNMEYRQHVQNNIVTQNQRYLEKMELSYKSNELTDKIRDVNKALQVRQDQLGWSNAIIIPSMSILVESLGVIKEHSLIESNTTSIPDALISAMKDPRLSSAGDQAGEHVRDKVSDGKLGQMVAKYAYFALPGAKGMYHALSSNDTHAEVMLMANMISDKKYNADEEAKLEGVSASGKVDSNNDLLIAISKIYEWMLGKIPIVVSVVAGVIAFIGYTVELAKYFYISPFVVAFALTTKKTHKIVDFLVTGLTIFFRPILLVIFIFFAIFIHSLINDIFMLYTMDQFRILGEIAGDENPLISATVELMQVLLRVFGTIGSIYIMWKLILTGPTWAMKLVGVESAQNDMVSDALSQRMDRQTFRF